MNSIGKLSGIEKKNARQKEARKPENTWDNALNKILNKKGKMWEE